MQILSVIVFIYAAALALMPTALSTLRLDDAIVDDGYAHLQEDVYQASEDGSFAGEKKHMTKKDVQFVATKLKHETAARLRNAMDFLTEACDVISDSNSTKAARAKKVKQMQQFIVPLLELSSNIIDKAATRDNLRQGRDLRYCNEPDCEEDDDRASRLHQSHRQAPRRAGRHERLLVPRNRQVGCEAGEGGDRRGFRVRLWSPKTCKQRWRRGHGQLDAGDERPEKNAIIDFLSVLPEVATQACKPKNIKRGFIAAGIIDEKTGRFPVFNRILGTCRRNPSKIEYANIVQYFPTYLNMVQENGRIDKEAFDWWGVACDRNSDGSEYLRNATISQESQQGSKCLMHSVQVDLWKQR
ncbi:hypothetical protein THAOC_18258, partial [Thalassiosira oceanica]